MIGIIGPKNGNKTNKCKRVGKYRALIDMEGSTDLKVLVNAEMLVKTKRLTDVKELVVIYYKHQYKY